MKWKVQLAVGRRMENKKWREHYFKSWLVKQKRSSQTNKLWLPRPPAAPSWFWRLKFNTTAGKGRTELTLERRHPCGAWKEEDEFRWEPAGLRKDWKEGQNQELRMLPKLDVVYFCSISLVLRSLMDPTLLCCAGELIFYLFLDSLADSTISCMSAFTSSLNLRQ